MFPGFYVLEAKLQWSLENKRFTEYKGTRSYQMEELLCQNKRKGGGGGGGVNTPVSGESGVMIGGTSFNVAVSTVGTLSHFHIAIHRSSD